MRKFACLLATDCFLYWTYCIQEIQTPSAFVLIDTVKRHCIKLIVTVEFVLWDNRTLVHQKGSDNKTGFTFLKTSFQYFFFEHLPLTASKFSFTRVWWETFPSFRAVLICWISRVNFESIIFVSFTTTCILMNRAIVNRIALTDKIEEALWRFPLRFSMNIIFASLVQPSIVTSCWIVKGDMK